MSIVPVSRLDPSDLLALGNNLQPRSRRSVRRRQPKVRVLPAVNRSLACLGERVAQLHAPATLAS